jgi:hypothetical protein
MPVAGIPSLSESAISGARQQQKDPERGLHAGDDEVPHGTF